MYGKTPPNSNFFHNSGRYDDSDLEYFTTDLLDEIARYSKNGISKEEILDGLSITWEELPPKDQVAFSKFFKYGRLIGLRDMSNSLFLQANSKNGAAPALAYLSRFSRDWASMNEESTTATIRVVDDSGNDLIPCSKVKIT